MNISYDTKSIFKLIDDFDELEFFNLRFIGGILQQYDCVNNLVVKSLNKVDKRLCIFSSIVELVEFANKYEYISLEDTQMRYFFSEFGYFDCCLYKDSLEGVRWKKIFKLKNEVIFTENLRDLEVFKENKEWSDFVFPIIYSEDFNFEKLEDIYFYFFNERPLIIPSSMFDEVFDKFCINVVDGKKKIIDKKFIPYINGDVLYIGNDFYDFIEHQVGYCFENFEVLPFIKKNLSFEIKNDFERQFYIDGEYSRLFAYDLNFRSFEKKLHSEVIKLLKLDLFCFLNNQSYGSWRRFLYCSFDLLKILYKVFKIFENFKVFCCDYPFKLVKGDGFDFYDSQYSVGVDIFFNLPSVSKIKESSLKIRNQDLLEYFIITSDRVIEVDLNNLSDFSCFKKVDSCYDDLFYWFDVDYFFSNID